MANKLGARVIGRETAEREKIIEKSRARHFGTRVIGDVLARKKQIQAAEEAAARGERPRKESRSDPAKRQAKKEAAKKAAESEEPDETIEAPVTANLEELEAALQANPAFYETLFEAEKQRPDGPRKGALRLFLAHEMQTEDREERREEIQALLAG